MLAGLALAASAEAEELVNAVSFSEALRVALSQNPNVRIQTQQVTASEGAVLQNRGAFNPELGMRVARSVDLRPLNVAERATLAAEGVLNQVYDSTRSSTTGLVLQKTYLTGIQASASFDFAAKSSIVNSGTGLAQQASGTLRFNLRIPLLRNAGEAVVGAQLRASELERDATEADLMQTAATTVLQTAQAYWDLLTRQKRLEILRVSEKRAKDLVAEMRKLISADQIPAAEINLASANEAEKRAASVSGEQAVQEAWASLARQLGMSAGQAKDAPLSGELPLVNDAVIAKAAGAVEALRQGALERRSDLSAARVRERAARALLFAARHNLKPQLDLIAGISTTGLSEGASALAFGPALVTNNTGPSVNVGLEYRWPFANEVARGQVLARSASYDQAQIRVADLEQSINTNVVTLTASLRRIGTRYKEGQAAAERYRITVQNEQTKRRLGRATLIDVINVLDRYDNAQLSLMALQQEYATVLAQIDFEIGRIVRKEGGEYLVDLAVLTGDPAAGFAE